MPRDADFKRLVRQRMHARGENYTTARARLLVEARRPAAGRIGGVVYPFDRLSTNAKNVLVHAQNEVQRTGQPAIDTEHLLLGLVVVRAGVAARVLTSLGVDEASVRRIVESVPPTDEPVTGQVHPTGRVRRVFELTFQLARQMGDETLGTEHLLLALVGEGTGRAAAILDDLGATQEKITTTIAAVRRRRDPGVTLARSESTPAGLDLADIVGQVTLPALQLARDRGETLDSGHFLLAIARLEEGRGRRILDAHGVSAEAIERQLGDAQA